MNDVRALSITLLAIALLPQMANADDKKLGIELTPYGAYRFGGEFSVEESDESYKLKDSSSFGVILNIPHSNNTQYEVLYSQQDTEAVFSGPTTGDPVVDLDLRVLQLGGTYLGGGETVRPYLVATIGGTYVKARSTGSGSDTFFSGSIGAGLLYRPYSRLGLRFEARAYGTLTSSSTTLFCGSGPDLNGCAIRLEGDLLSQVETFAGVVFRF
jgi:hypothetical protein